MFSAPPGLLGAAEGTLAQSVLDNVLARVRAGSIRLPAMPTAAVECLALLRGGDFSMSEAAAVIERDPALAARVLTVCNSAAFGGAEKARTLTQAAARLGTDNLRVVLFEAVTLPIYQSRDVRIRKACLAVWRHCRAVATCARHLAEALGAGDPGEAYLAGLLHDIGKPILIAMLLKAERRLLGTHTDVWLEADTWLELVQAAHRPVGVAFCEKWQLPESVVGAVAYNDVYDAGPPRSLVNCVRFANALAKEVGFCAGRLDPHEVRDTVREGRSLLGLSDRDLLLAREQLNEAWCASA